jgi:hypothetical protein
MPHANLYDWLMCRIVGAYGNRPGVLHLYYVQVTVLAHVSL